MRALLIVYASYGPSSRIEPAHKLATMQLQDNDLRNIAEVLSKEPGNSAEKQIHEDYQLENNRVYRINK